MAKRGEVWTVEETRALIGAWGDRKIQEKIDGNHRNASIYSSISEELKKLGFDRDWKQCRTKAKHLKNEYKKYNDGLGKSGNSRKKPPMFYCELDNFLGDRPEATGLVNGVDTSLSDTSLANSSTGDSINEDVVADREVGK